MATLFLGSSSPKAPEVGTATSVNGEEIKSQVNPNLPSNTVVVIDTPDFDIDGNPVPLDKKLTEIRNAFRLHSGMDPEWVDGHDPDFAKIVCQVFNCDVGRPEGWSE